MAIRSSLNFAPKIVIILLVTVLVPSQKIAAPSSRIQFKHPMQSIFFQLYCPLVEWSQRQTESPHFVGGYLSDTQQWLFVRRMSYGSQEFACTVTQPKKYSRSNICSWIVFTLVILSCMLPMVTYHTSRVSDHFWQNAHFLWQNTWKWPVKSSTLTFGWYQILVTSEMWSIF